jgi:ornithine cyclodeaminase/alanine dehydrogenase-like protein (mu-crystallin family)
VLAAREIEEALDFRGAVAALRAALEAGLDPETEPARVSFPFGENEILAMPSSDGRFAGVKLVSIAPGNPTRGLPRINGVYVLFDAGTMMPAELLDGTALTSLRTPAVSALGVDLVAPADARTLVVFGTGPQAEAHVHALRAVRPLDTIHIVGRSPGRAIPLVERLKAQGLDAYEGSAATVAEADIVACCTTSREPLFPSSALPSRTVVVACGSHEPGAREVDGETVRACGVLVEARSAALREAGDVIQAGVAAGELVTLAELVRAPGSPVKPRLIKTVGMGWEDLVIAAAVVNSVRGTA